VRRIAFCLLLVVCSFFIQAQNRKLIDSLFQELDKAKIDTSKANILLSLSENFQRLDIDSSMIFARQAYEISKQTKFLKGLANSSHCIGMVFVFKGEYDSCLTYWNKCLDIRLKINDLKGISGSYNNIGIVYKNQGNYQQALEYFQKALVIFEKRNDSLNISNCQSNMGSIQDDLKNYTKAIEYYQNSIKIKKNLGNEKDIASCYLNIGSIYKNSGDFEKAFVYYQNSLSIFEKINDKRGIGSCYSNIGVYYEYHQNFKLAQEYYLKSLELKEVQGDKFGISLLYSNLASVNLGLAELKNITELQSKDYYKKSIKYSEQALLLAKETGSLPRINTAYEVLYKGWGKLNNYKKAFEYAELFININDSLLNADKAEILEDMEAKYQSEKKQLNIEKLENEKNLQNETIARKDAENRKQRILIFSFIAGFITILIFSILLFRLFSQKKKAFKQLALQNEEILQKNEEINTQKEEIESQRDIVILQKEQIEEIHKSVTDSINYAKYIQQAVLPSQLKLENILDDYFIFFKPKDIVSGDFYWITKVNEWLIVVVADCTGHGVPGAFMSMLGISFLNEIVRKNEVNKASQVLNLLRESVIDALSQTGQSEEQKDGMDISIIAIKSHNQNHKIKAQSEENVECKVIKNQVQNPKIQVPRQKIEDRSEKIEDNNSKILKPVVSEVESSSNPINLSSDIFHAQWAGANNPLWIVRTLTQSSGLLSYEPEVCDTDFPNFKNLENLEEIKPDKMPIAIYDNMEDFTNHEFILQKGDIIYMKTDGFEDSMGGPKGKKFLSKNLKQLLLDNCQLPMCEQKQMLEETLKDWIGMGEQLDDITVLGIRV